jgi:hypothetical protein
MSQFSIGDKVVINPAMASGYPGVWTVRKVPAGSRGVNYVLDPESGGRGLRIPAEYLSPAPTGATVTTVSIPTVHDPGTVVRFRDKAYVVTASDRKGGHRLFPLGGSDRYYRGIMSGQFAVVPRDSIIVDGID